MPELPEVETTIRRLEPELVNRRITALQVNWPRHVVDLESLQVHLPGHRVTGLGRRGKYIISYLDPADQTVLIHLRMSGRLEVMSVDAPEDKHAHTTLVLDDGRALRFSDTRKFGRLILTSDPETVLGKLGVEPLSESFTVDWLSEGVARRKRQIKSLLLDQSFVAGLGNIYTDEALFRAGVDPRRPAKSLVLAELAKLHANIQTVLGEAIEHQGTSLDWVYPGGEMQSRLLVYSRGGEGCAICGTPIERIVLGQRGTHFCPTCQR